ncbi:unnamed protein product, partial [Medioppia subpectinata]
MSSKLSANDHKNRSSILSMTSSAVTDGTLAQRLTGVLSKQGFKVLFTSSPVQLWSKSADTNQWSIDYKKIVAVITGGSNAGGYRQCLIRVYDRNLETIHLELDINGRDFAYEWRNSRFHVFGRHNDVSNGWTGLRFVDINHSTAFRQLIADKTWHRLDSKLGADPTVQPLHVKYKVAVGGQTSIMVTTGPDGRDIDGQPDIPSLVTTASKRQKWTIESWTQTEPLVTTTTTPAQEISHKEVLDRALKAMSAAIHFIQTHDISTSEELVTRNVPKVKQCYGLDTVDEIPDEVIEKCVDYSTADAILSSAAVLDQLMTTKLMDKSRHKLANNGLSVPTIPKEIEIFTENDGNGGEDVDVLNPKSIDISLKTLTDRSLTARQMMPMSVPLVEWSAGGDIGKCCLTDSKPSDQLVSTKMAKKFRHLFPVKEEEEYEEVSDNDEEEEEVINTSDIPIDISLRHTSLTGCDGEETAVKRKQWSSAEICTNPCPLSSTDEDNDQMLDQTYDESMDEIVDEIFNGILDEELTNQIPDIVKKETSVAKSDKHSPSLTYVPSLRSSAEEEVDGNGMHVCGGGGDEKQIPRSLARELNRWEQTFSRLDWKRMSVAKKCTPVAQVVGHKASPAAAASPVVETGIPDYTVDYHLRQLSQLMSNGSGIDAQHRDWWTHTGDCPPTYVTVAAVKRWVKLLGAYCRPVSMVFLDVFVWAPRLSTKWSVHWPAALCLLEDRRRCGYYLRVYDKHFHQVLWERQLTVDVEHRALDVRLHEVRFVDCRAGLAFQSAGKGFEFALSVRHVLSGLDERLERLRADKELDDREMDCQSKRQANGLGKWFGHWFTAGGKVVDKGSVVGDVLAYESDTTKALIDSLLIHPAIKGLIIAMIDKHRAAAVGMAGGLALNRR